jgi:hypothetical protein
MLKQHPTASLVPNTPSNKKKQHLSFFYNQYYSDQIYLYKFTSTHGKIMSNLNPIKRTNIWYFDGYKVIFVTNSARLSKSNVCVNQAISGKGSSFTDSRYINSTDE